MKKCEYCGYSGNSVEVYCRKCGVELAIRTLAIAPKQDGFSWLPRSNDEWTRSLTYPLFVCCLGLQALALSGGWGNHRGWRDAGAPVLGTFLPFLGLLLAAVSCGPGLSWRFRIVSVIVAVVSVVPWFMPALA